MLPRDFGRARRAGVAGSGGVVGKSRRALIESSHTSRGAGEMAEWLKAHAWKACLGETLTWVRIPLSPPCIGSTPITGCIRAEQVQVFASKLYKWDANHELIPVSDFVPMNLR